MTKQKIWIGLAKVTPFPNNNTLSGSKGAFVNVIDYAEDVADFTKHIKDALRILDFELHEVEDAEEFAQRIKQHEVEEYLVEIAQEVKKTGKLSFGNFHAYDE